MPNEFTALSEKEKEAIKTFREAEDICIDFSRSRFEAFVRWYRLFRGDLPQELDGTFSKVMLPTAHSIIENELPRQSRNVLSGPRWFDLRANEPLLEDAADDADKWLKYQMETVQRISSTIIPTNQSVHIFGVGYRMYGHLFKTSVTNERVPSSSELGIPVGFEDKKIETTKSVISGQFVSPFHIMPLPGGGIVNAFDDASHQVSDGFIWTDYMSERQIESEVKGAGWNKSAAGRMFKSKRGGELDPSEEYLQQIETGSNSWHNFTTPQWVKTIRDKQINITSRYMVQWFFQRDRWLVIGEKAFVLYDGPPLISVFPLAKFVASYDLNNWYGKGLIGVAEDLIISMMMLFNHRMDYLAGTLHPATFVPENLMEHLGGDKSLLDPQPYNTIEYPTTITDIQRAVHRERFPDISQQAFIEDEKMNQQLQKAVGQPDSLQGMAGGGSMGDGSATSVTSLISEGTARSMMRAINSEDTGLRDSLYLTLVYGEKYKTDTEQIRRTGEGGFPWSEIPHEAIISDYGIEVMGTRGLNMANESFRKMLESAQLIMNNPNVENQKELIRQIMEMSNVYKNVDEIIGGLGGDAMSIQPAGEGTAEAAPDMGGQASLSNQLNSVANRQTVEPGTGAPVAAGNILV